jgi:transposase
MLRRHRVEGKAISEVAKSFGMSRQAFYVTDATFSEHGIPGLLPHRRGPRGAHKCTDEVLDFVEQWSPEGKETLVEAVRRRFSVTINPRSIERALARRKKKRARKLETQE